MKNKIIIFLLGFLLIPTIAFAEGSAIGEVSSEVTVGDSVTFTLILNNTAAWNVKIVGTGATDSCTEIYADVTADAKNTTKRLTLTCKALRVGDINFNASGDITSEDGTNSNITVSKKVIVNAKVQNNTKPNIESNTESRLKDSESRLSSLEIKDYNIDFDSNTYEYNLVVDKSVKNIEIIANPLSSNASISGIGLKQLIDDTNNFEIVVTAEDGTKKIYKINVSVKEEPIIIEINGEKYSIIESNSDLTTPNNFKKDVIKINDHEVSAFINEKINMTLVGIIDKDKKINYAIYKNNKYELFNQVQLSDFNLYIVEGNLKNYSKTTVIIENNEYPAFDYDDKIKIIYAMNLDNGEYDFYKYDSINKTIELFAIEDKENIKTNNNISITVIIILSISILGLILLLLFKRKKKKE